MKCLFKGTLKEFKEFTNKDLSLYKWKVYEQEIKDRFNQIKDYKYTNLLTIKANTVLNEYDQTEIISWLDSEMIMLKIIKQLNKKLIDGITIIQELHIPFTNKRADYILTKNNKILILEFSYSEEKYSNYQYQTKLNQVINYKELLNNIFPKHIEIGTFTFIIHPEDKNEESNCKDMKRLTDLINYFFEETKESALYYLEHKPF